MKKLMMLAGAFALGFVANAECTWSWWTGDKNADREIKGCQLGLACENKQTTGAQVAVLWNRTQKVKSGAQVSIGYNRAHEVKNGPQVAFVNIAESAALQFGLLCFNDSGFLPFFVFFNFDTHMFGGESHGPAKK